MIGPPRFYFLRYWREVTWVPNYNYTITTFCNGIAAIGHLRCARINQVHLFGFCFAVSTGLKLLENIPDVLSSI